MPVFLAAVNDTLKRVGVLAGTAQDLSAFTSTAGYQHQIDVVLQLWREGILELYSHGLLAKEAGTGTFYLAEGTREYALMPDFERMAWPHVIRALSGVRLTWDPEVVCPLTSPTTYVLADLPINDAGARVITLAAGEHAILQYPRYEPLVGSVNVNGVSGSGNRLRAMAGAHQNPYEYDDGDTNARFSHILRMRDIEIGHLEGIAFDKMGKSGDCIHWVATTAANGGVAPAGTLYVQHCRGQRIMYQDAAQFGHSITQHGDFLQVSQQALGLHVDYCTADTYRQGVIINSSLADDLAPGAGLVNGGSLKRLNINLYDTSSAPVSPPPLNAILLRLQDDCSLTPIQWALNEVYLFDRESPPESLSQMVLPSTTHGQVSCAGSVEGDQMTFPASTLISGSVKYGVPPGGDYVPDTFTGLGYTSPGYGTTVPPRGVHLEEYRGGYAQMLIDQALATQWTGQPHAFALSPCDDKIRIDREPTSAEEGSRYQYLYEKSLAFTSTMATTALPVTDDTYRAMVPFISEWYARTQKKDFDHEAFSAGLARAVLDATRMPLKPSYGKHRRVR